ncbi:hypothetical protein SAMN05877838_0049 [Hoeflea halophila]|uniref:Uncharacterized protein n=1 Tax=Hoeflea halophila TaxID=714899 RepID=A0A286HKN1_9HYPH|nr:hypothetical protein [Hoeflea halophila]SOE08338.1 hypothetical protein SAMN05877838_0049 [Hoeflea halophila]
MVYSLDFLAAIFAMATGFATAWVAVEIVRLAGWREPEPAEGRLHPVRVGIEVALAAVLGPRLLLVNGFRNWRAGMMSLPLYALLALVAAGWSMCSGVIVLQLAFASGYFMA